MPQMPQIPQMRDGLWLEGLSSNTQLGHAGSEAGVVVALYGVGLTGDGQDTLPSAAVHVEAPRRVLHEFRDGDEHLPIRSPTKYDSARAYSVIDCARGDRDRALFPKSSVFVDTVSPRHVTYSFTC